MTKPSDRVISFIDQILNLLNHAYPNNAYAWSLLKKEEDEGDLTEALEICENESLIEDRSGTHRITQSGKHIIQVGGYSEYINQIITEGEMKKKKEELEYDKLIEELRKVRRENKLFKWFAIAGLIGLLIQVIEFILKLLN